MPKFAVLQDLFQGFSHGSNELQTLIYKNYTELHRVPANLGIAKARAKKTKIFRSKANTSKPEASIPLCCSPSELSHLGSSFPLFFDFFRFCILLLVIIVLVSGIYSFATNVKENDCFGLQDCAINNFIVRQSWFNKHNQQNLVEAQGWINNACVVLLIIAIYCYRRREYKSLNGIYTQTATPALYTLRLEGISPKATDEDIEEYVKSNLDEKDQESIAKVVRGYDVKRLVRQYRELNQIQAKWTKLSQIAKQRKNPKKIQKKLDSLQHKQGLIQGSLRRLVHAEVHPTNISFVSFERVSDAQKFYNRVKKNTFQRLLGTLLCNSRCFAKKSQLFQNQFFVTVDFAPEPTDILWENFGVSNREHFLRFLQANILTFVTFVLAFSVFVGIKVLDIRYVKDESNDADSRDEWSLPAGVSFALSIVVILLNPILMGVIRSMERFELKYTHTRFFFGLANKIAIITFLNTAFASIFANIVGAWIEGDLAFSNVDILFGKHGIIIDIFFVFASNMIVTPLLFLLHPDWLVLKIKRFLLSHGKLREYSQAEANAVFQGPYFDLAISYASLIRQVWFSAFYAPILPISSLMSLVGLFLTYYVTKYHLLRRCSVPYYKIGPQLHETMLNLLELTPLLFALGNLVWGFAVNQGQLLSRNSEIATYMMVALAGLNFLMSREVVNERIMKKASKVDGYKTFSEAQEEFYSDYSVQNPATRNEAIHGAAEGIARRQNLVFTKLSVFQHRKLRRYSSIVLNQGIINNLEIYSLVRASASVFASDSSEKIASQVSRSTTLKILHEEKKTESLAKLLGIEGTNFPEDAIEELLPGRMLGEAVRNWGTKRTSAANEQPKEKSLIDVSIGPMTHKDIDFEKNKSSSPELEGKTAGNSNDIEQPLESFRTGTFKEFIEMDDFLSWKSSLDRLAGEKSFFTLVDKTNYFSKNESCL